MERGSAQPSRRAEERPAVLAVSRRLRTMSTVTQRYADRVSRHLKVHRTDLTALGAIAAAAGEDRALSAGELARRLDMSPAAVTALIDRLERVGHVERQRDGADRRRIVVDITDSASAVSAAMFHPLATHLRQALAQYSDDELDVVRRVLDDVVQAAQIALEEPLPQPPPQRHVREEQSAPETPDR